MLHRVDGVTAWEASGCNSIDPWHHHSNIALLTSKILFFSFCTFSFLINMDYCPGTDRLQSCNISSHPHAPNQHKIHVVTDKNCLPILNQREASVSVDWKISSSHQVQLRLNENATIFFFQITLECLWICQCCHHHHILNEFICTLNTLQF